MAEIRRLRDLNADLRDRLAEARCVGALVKPLRKRLQREQVERRRQYERAELWKHRALRK